LVVVCLRPLRYSACRTVSSSPPPLDLAGGLFTSSLQFQFRCLFYYTILLHFHFTSSLIRLLFFCHVVDHIMSCHVTYGISSELMICLFPI
jgi:hypothetical protein